MAEASNTVADKRKNMGASQATGLAGADGHPSPPSGLGPTGGIPRADDALLRAALKHLEWIEKERAGPNYGGLTRDTHPDGELIWRRWWDEQLDLCADTERLCREGVAKARGAA